MTEDEGDLLFEIKETYWQKFRDLVKKTLNRAPRHLEDELRYMLQDMSSCWHPGIPDRKEDI